MKMTNLLKMLSFTAILVILISCFAGCGNKEKASTKRSFKNKASTSQSGGTSTKTDGDTDQKSESDNKNETATPTEDEELTKLKNMTPEQIAKEIFEPAAKAFSIFDGGSLDCEWDQEVIEKGDFTYYKVKKTQEHLDTNVNFSSYKEFYDYARKFFSKEFCDKLLASKHYINVDGELYAVPTGRGGNMSYYSHSYAVTSSKKDEIEYTATVKLVKEDYMDRLFTDPNFEPTDDMLEIEKIKYTYKKIDGEWVFTNFQSVY